MYKDKEASQTTTPDPFFFTPEQWEIKTDAVTKTLTEHCDTNDLKKGTFFLYWLMISLNLGNLFAIC